MSKNILYLVACIVAIIVAWGIFKTFAKYAFLIILAVIIVAILVKVGKSKFAARK